MCRISSFSSVTLTSSCCKLVENVLHGSSSGILIIGCVQENAVDEGLEFYSLNYTGTKWDSKVLTKFRGVKPAPIRPNLLPTE